MTSFRIKAVSAATLLLAAQGMAPVHAADLAPMPDTSEWQFTVAPYVWGVAIKGGGPGLGGGGDLGGVVFAEFNFGEIADQQDEQNQQDRINDSSGDPIVADLDVFEIFHSL